MNSDYRPPRDMDQTFHTLIHAGAKSEVEELAGVRRALGGLLGKEFVKKSDEDYSSLNKVVADNIDLKIPSEGEVIKRLVELAQEKNIKYIPSHEATIALNDYCTLKQVKNPLNPQPSLAQVP
jgi:predicted transcriptional regulator